MFIHEQTKKSLKETQTDYISVDDFIHVYIKSPVVKLWYWSNYEGGPLFSYPGIKSTVDFDGPSLLAIRTPANMFLLKLNQIASIKREAGPKWHVLTIQTKKKELLRLTVEG